MLATFGVVLGAAYMLWLTKRVIFGAVINSEVKNLNDVNKAEIAMLASESISNHFFRFLPNSSNGDFFSVSVNTLINNYETALISK